MKLWVTLLAILIGIAVVLGVMRDAERTNAPVDRQVDAVQVAEESSASSASEKPVSLSPLSESEAATQKPTESTSSPEHATTIEPIPGLHPVTVSDGRDAVIGDDDPNGPFEVKVELSRYGAAVRKISLADYYQRVDKPDHYIVHEEIRIPGTDRIAWLAYAAKAITVNGVRIPLENNDVWLAGPVETNTDASSVTFTATLGDEHDQPVIRLVRRYSVTAGSYDLKLEQRVINLTDRPVVVKWEQNLQGDLVNDSGYLGDRRKYDFGYFALWWDARKAGIYTEDAEFVRSKILRQSKDEVWPVEGLNPQAELAWVGSLNRYFAVVTHMALPEDIQATRDVPPLEKVFPSIYKAVVADPSKVEPKNYDKAMVLKAWTPEMTIQPGSELPLDLGIFAGPRKPELFDTPPYSILHLDQTIIYSLGGMCAFCTFQWLAHALLWLLKLFEGQILVLGGIGIGVHDWGVSIILLVLLVRLLLHPITKRAQINMQKMGKMMQAIQPEVEKIKKKYKDDQQKINAEMMKLYREKGVNPANMLGCLPMFLQTPIWIALYAMLYYAIELRHEPAFWGFFQWISGGKWLFLADLSSQDNFIQLFSEPHNINLLLTDIDFQSINIIPLLMAVVFYFQQKLTSPPPANEQQAQQQKMMKFMIFLFPVFLYFAPSGLNLYILASTSAGIIDSYIVRKHIREQEESGELFKPKAPKPGSLRDRIAKAVEAKQRELAEQQKKLGQQQPGRKPRKRR